MRPGFEKQKLNGKFPPPLETQTPTGENFVLPPGVATARFFFPCLFDGNGFRQAS